MLLEYDTEQAIQEVLENASFKNNAVPWSNQFIQLRSEQLTHKQYESSGTPLEYSHVAESSIASFLQNATDLDDQIWQLCERTYPTESFYRLRFLRAHQIQQNIQQNVSFLLPHAKVMPFGSLMNGFATMNSKMYLSVQCGNDNRTPNSGRNNVNDGVLEFYGKDIESDSEQQLTGAGRQMKCVASALEYYLPNCTEFLSYPRATIPFLAFQDEDIQSKTEVCMNNM